LSSPFSPAGAIEAADFHADLFGVRVVHLVKDHQGLPPGVAGGGAISGVAVDIPEADERAGGVVAVAYGLFQFEGPLV
jgi:hypothetical protein